MESNGDAGPSAVSENGSDSEDIANNKAWKNENRHIFILSSAGKPVYSRYGCEDKLVTLFGVMQALVSFVQDSDDVIQAIYSGSRVVVFAVKGPIILVAVANRKESVLFLKKQLMYAYNQVVSVLTLTRVTKIFEQRHNFDLRRLLTGSERLIDHLLDFTETRAEFFLDGVQCLPLTSSVRETISSVIVSICSKIKNLVFGILVAHDKLITLIHLKKYILKPCDLHLIFNMVSSYGSLRTAECWTPICLPNFDSSGYLHGHITYLCDESEACLLLLTVDAELFHELSDAKKKITEKLVKNQSIEVINSALSSASLLSMEQIKIPSVKHFLYKCLRSSNLLYPPIGAPFSLTEDGPRGLLLRYQMVHGLLHGGQSAAGNQSSTSLKVVFQQFQTETILGWTTEKFELFAALDPLITKPAATEALDKLLKWIQKEEDKFIMGTVPSF